MNTRYLTALVALTLLAADSLSAQRRGTSSGGSSGRSSPSRGGGSSSGGSRGGSSSGGSSSGSRGSSSGGSQSGSSGSSRSGSSGSGTSSTGTSSNSTQRRQGSKIGAIRGAANKAGARGGRIVGGGVWLGSCWGCDYYGWYGDRWGWYHGGWWYPVHRGATRGDYGEEYGQGYDDYPYAGNDSTQGFVKSHVNRRRNFGAVTGQYFSDAGSTTRAGRFGIEGAHGLWRGELEYSYYAEPTAGAATDRLHTFRLAGGIQPRLGEHAYLIAALGFRGLAVNNGSATAGGPEAELGVQLLPRRPFGLNVTGRAAALTWHGNDYFALREVNTTGSIFVNRMEIQAGWHWMKVGGAPAFGGPVAGLRVWF